MKSTMILCTMVLMLSAQVAFGQGEEDWSEGEKLADGALEHYMGGRYDKAATEYLKAYHVYPNAIMIYNVAKAMQKQGKYGQAMMWLGKAEAQKEMPLNEETRAKIPEFREELKAQWSQMLFDEGSTEFAAKRWGQASTKYQKAYEVQPKALFLYSQARVKHKLGQTKRALELVTAALNQKEMALSAKEETDAQAFRLGLEGKKNQRSSEGGLGLLGWSGIGVAAVGAGLMTYGGVLALGVADEAKRLESEPGQTQAQFRADRDAAQSEQDIARVLFYSGAATLVVGGGLLAWDVFGGEKEEAKEDQVSMNLRVGPSAVAWEVTW